MTKLTITQADLLRKMETGRHIRITWRRTSNKPRQFNLIRSDLEWSPMEMVKAMTVNALIKAGHIVKDHETVSITGWIESYWKISEAGRAALAEHDGKAE